ncbi:hypothetical protein RIF29_28928 [Crotalaria pallida]|uniref:Uncharacterized protein n=1 Tax=Crotalaria pallida TaxID=3830 RepID=A0AAN9EFR8_CROPI
MSSPQSYGYAPMPQMQGFNTSSPYDPVTSTPSAPGRWEHSVVSPNNDFYNIAGSSAPRIDLNTQLFDESTSQDANVEVRRNPHHAEALLDLTRTLVGSVKSMLNEGVTPAQFAGCLLKDYGQGDDTVTLDFLVLLTVHRHHRAPPFPFAHRQSLRPVPPLLCKMSINEEEIIRSHIMEEIGEEEQFQVQSNVEEKP